MTHFPKVGERVKNHGHRKMHPRRNFTALIIHKIHVLFVVDQILLRVIVRTMQDMRRKVELEYKKNLSRTNEEYKNEMNRLLKAERDKSAKCEKRYVRGLSNLVGVF